MLQWQEHIIVMISGVLFIQTVKPLYNMMNQEQKNHTYTNFN